ncbi:MAG: DUF3800 domain-containing protein, partial [Anaerolineae bacterium]|nr:DUF3800 domain-containing protein [Anaerolineae bacterium]
LEQYAGAIVEELLPEDRWDTFEEFHANELFWGGDEFIGVDQKQRFDAIELLLGGMRDDCGAVIYGAVNKGSLRKTLYASSNPLDVAFRLCMRGVEKWLSEKAPDELCIVVIDDSNQNVRNVLKKSFRQLRSKVRPPEYNAGELRHIHDDIYFGDSKDSVGIQIADLCGFFIYRNLKGNKDSFYDIFKDHIYYGAVDPK